MNRQKNFEDWLCAAPKAELHLHLDGTLEASRLLSLAQKNGVQLPYRTLEQVEAAYQFENLQSFLDLYYLGASVLRDEEDFYHLMMDYLQRCRQNNIVHAEIMIEPQTYLPQGIEFPVFMAGFKRAIAEAQSEWGISVQLILSFLRHLSEAEALEVLEMAEPYRDDFVAIGLASGEKGNPPEKFTELYRRARERGYRLTAHAGEEGPPAYIRSALEQLQVERIDHGVRCVQDEAVLEELRQRDIPLTVCPLSNVRLCVFGEMQQHNILDLLQRGLKVTVNSDDPAYFGGHLNRNFIALSRALKLDRAQALQLLQNGFEASFLAEAEKQKYLQLLREFAEADAVSDNLLALDAARPLQRCDALADISAAEGAICRTYLTEEHRLCNQQVQQWMQAAGMDSYTDAAGNCWGHYAGEEGAEQTLILGSHLDTVPNAGRYDGILGVVSAIEVVERFHRRGRRFPFHIDVVGFADEEGSRFGATLLGSRAVAGNWDPDLLALRDGAGKSMAEAFADFGLEPQAVARASRAGDKLLGYWELHIEQGPVLEERGLPLGVVNAIAGARRLLFTVRGRAGHAGTVPMEMRRDALVAAAAAVEIVDRLARRFAVVATVGQMEVSPGAVNVIPASCRFSLDIRSGNDALRDNALAAMVEEIEVRCDQSRVTVEYREIHSAAAVACAPALVRAGSRALERCGIDPLHMPSGAGHDAMAMAAAADIGMLFLRCTGGVSHHPDESVTAEDVTMALDVLEAAVEETAAEKIALEETAPAG